MNLVTQKSPNRQKIKTDQFKSENTVKEEIFVETKVNQNLFTLANDITDDSPDRRERRT